MCLVLAGSECVPCCVASAGEQPSSHSSSASGGKQSTSGSKANLSEILVLPQPIKKASTAKRGLNQKTVYYRRSCT